MKNRTSDEERSGKRGAVPSRRRAQQGELAPHKQLMQVWFSENRSASTLPCRSGCKGTLERSNPTIPTRTALQNRHFRWGKSLFTGLRPSHVRGQEFESPHLHQLERPANVGPFSISNFWHRTIAGTFDHHMTTKRCVELVRCHPLRRTTHGRTYRASSSLTSAHALRDDVRRTKLSMRSSLFAVQRSQRLEVNESLTRYLAKFGSLASTI